MKLGFMGFTNFDTENPLICSLLFSICHDPVSILPRIYDQSIVSTTVKCSLLYVVGTKLDTNRA